MIGPRNDLGRRKVICYLSGSSGDWGGASRVLFSNIRILDRSRYKPILLLPSPGPILPLLDELQMHYEIWGQQHEPNGPVGYVRDIVSAMRFFRKNAVDLLHINHANYWRPAEVAAAKLLRIPIVTHYHVVIKEPGPFVRYSDMIAVVSEYAAAASEPKNVPKTVIHNSVIVERFDRAQSVRSELDLRADDVVVSFIGQIREIKGIDLFIKMAHAIAHPGVKFLIVGECRDPRKFEGAYTEERLRAEIGDDARIRYVGYRSDVHNLYCSSDLIVMPSRWGEPFGLINIEAGAARKPIVSTRDGGIPEIIRHGENGFLIEPGDLSGLIHYVDLLINNAQLRQRMGQAAREIVQSRFTDQPVRRLEGVYDALIGAGMGIRHA
jgi:glycosyltransferase involved in cell wall biosynthesis